MTKQKLDLTDREAWIIETCIDACLMEGQDVDTNRLVKTINDENPVQRDNALLLTELPYF